MSHYRAVAFMWVLVGVAGLTLSLVQCISFLTSAGSFDDPGLIATFLAIGFSVLAIGSGFALLRGRAWGRIVASCNAIILLAYCLAFLLMVAMEFGPLAVCAAVLGLGIGGYTLAVVWILKPDPSLSSAGG